MSTKDERFLIEIYRATSSGSEVVDPNQIAKKLGYKPHLTKEILKGLGQGNLIKIYGPEEIALTDRGEKVARSLLS